MSLDPAANFGKVAVNQGYVAADTSITLVATDPNLSQLPDPSTAGAYNVVWWDATTYTDPADDPNREIVRVTAKSTNVLTVTRAQESTTATDKNTSGSTYKMMLAPTAKLVSDLNSLAIDVGSVYGYVTDAAYGATGDGSTDDYTALNAAAAALTHIVFPSGTYRIASDLTFANTITLEFKQGANISVDSGKTLTVSGNIIAGNWQIFSGSGSVTLSTRCPIRFDRWDGTAADKVEVHTDLSMASGKYVRSGFVVVETAELAGDAVDTFHTTVAHGLGTTPTLNNIALSIYISSGYNAADVPAFRAPYVETADATNITIYSYVIDAGAANTKYKVVARIFLT